MQVDLHRADFRDQGEDLLASKAQGVIAESERRWRERMPKEVSRLFGWLLGQEQGTVLELCAFCVAISLNGVTQEEGVDDLAEISRAAGLDMRDWWSVTASGYLSSVPKARILVALSEAGSPPDAELSQLTKSELTLAAEQRMSGTGWLPAILKPIAARVPAGARDCLAPVVRLRESRTE